MKSNCLNCRIEFVFYQKCSTGKYCSNTCQQEFQNKQKIIDWKNGDYDGVVSKNSVASLSGTIRDYLIEINKNQCIQCGWGIKNRFTNKIPLHIHHIDGNALNCKAHNLQVLCPNCHSLTENFGKLNKTCNRKKRKIIYS